MRKFIALCTTFLVTSILFAQAPDKMSYQSLVRNDSNQLLSSTTVGMRVSVLQGSSAGPAVFIEKHNPTTNDHGLISIEIGGGTVISGNFSAIDWANGPYFIKTETDPSGGTNYSISGISQFKSVPFALHAKSAETISGSFSEIDPIFAPSVAAGIMQSDTINWNNKLDTVYAGNGIVISRDTVTAPDSSNKNPFYLGQDTLGGIVYYIYLDSAGQKHGLIVSKTEGSGIYGDTVLINANSSSDGRYNTNLMQTGAGTIRNWVDSLGSPWYIPSIDELEFLWYHRFFINNSNASGLTLILADSYWSSTENNYYWVSSYFFRAGRISGHQKHTSIDNVRAIKRF